MEEYSKEQLWDLYEQLPESLKKAVFSPEIGESIKKICGKNKLGNSYSDILKQAGYVFLGILSPEEFGENLKNPAVFAEINNEVFLSLKDDLELLYGIKIKEAGIKEAIKKNPIVKKRKDEYLEPIE